MHARAWVPIDDTHTMFIFIWWKKSVAANSLPQPTYKDGTPIGGTGRLDQLLPYSTDWLGRFRMSANAGNDWHIDRESQRDNTNYTGIEGVHLQDQAITESMGGIVDHDLEQVPARRKLHPGLPPRLRPILHHSHPADRSVDHRRFPFRTAHHALLPPPTISLLDGKVTL